jgi:DNA-binding HxlR family transcriptional regulator
LDVIGERWTLLVVRELLLGPARFKDLQAGLPGIATNLLADRLGRLEELGLLVRDAEGPRPIYRLTEFGAGLREPIEAMVRWRGPLMFAGPGEDHADPRWLAVAIPALLPSAEVPEPRVVHLRVDSLVLRIEASESGVCVRPLQDADHVDIDREVTMFGVLGAAWRSGSFDEFLQGCEPEESVR